MSHSLIRSLFALQEQQIDVVTSTLSSEVVKMMPEVRNIYTLDLEQGKLSLSKILEFARMLKEKQYQVAYILPNSTKFALIPWLADIKQRIGWRGTFRYGFLTNCYSHKYLPNHQARVFAALAHGVNNDFKLLNPRLILKDKNSSNLDNWLNITMNYNYAAICPGYSNSPQKAWPYDRFAKLAKKLTMLNFKIFILGGHNDIEHAKCIKELFPSNNIIVLAGKLSVAETAQVINRCNLVIGIDSGLIHLSAALNKPTLGIYAATDPNRYRPLGDNVYIVSSKFGIQPMEVITAEQVFNKVKEILNI